MKLGTQETISSPEVRKEQHIHYHVGQLIARLLKELQPHLDSRPSLAEAERGRIGKDLMLCSVNASDFTNSFENVIPGL